MKNFNGKALFIDRSDINTDEIIPAKYLTEISRDALKPYLLEDLKLEGFDRAAALAGKRVIITRDNFGCGSSREHAPWALEANGINLVIAESFARIFKQNMFNCGMLAIELPAETIEEIFCLFADRETVVNVDLKRNAMVIQSGDRQKEFVISISDFNRELVKTGGWVEYADSRY